MTDRRSFFKMLGLVGAATAAVAEAKPADAHFANYSVGYGKLMPGEPLMVSPRVEIVTIPGNMRRDEVRQWIYDITMRGRELNVEFIFMPEGFDVVTNPKKEL